MNDETLQAVRNRLGSEADRAEVHHMAIRRWPLVTSEAWWNNVVQATRALGTERICEIGCEYGLHLRELEEFSYTGVDYGYFVEYAQRRHPEAGWVKLDFDRYDAGLFDTLFDLGATYFVRARLEHVRDPDLLLSCIAAFVRRGAAAVIAHHAMDAAAADAELPPFLRRRLRNERLISSIAELGVEARILGVVPAPVGPISEPLTLVAAGSPEQLNLLSRITLDEGAPAPVDAGESESQAVPEAARELTPESMLLNSDIPLLSRRLVHAAQAPRVDAQGVFEAILRARDDASPFSLVRLGNGEARVLGFPDYIPPIWLARSIRNWFKNRDAELAVKDLQDEASELIAEADVIGVLRRRYRDDQYSLPPQLLELYGLVSPYTRICGADVHLEALNSGFLDALLQDARGVSLVCGHELARPFGRAFGIAEVRLFKVPAQAKFFYDPNDEPHFPVVFDRLRESMDVRWPGEVFLVGAGFLGKIYCGWIKRRGGIALDIGSVFDLWAGQHTRGSDPSVAESYSLLG